VAGPGFRGAWRHRRELFLLALPLVDPLPKALRAPLEPTLVSWTTASALAINRMLEHPMTREGNVVRTASGTMDVLGECSGMLAISRLLVLAALVVALFPTNAWQKVALFASTFVLGFVSNALRIALLAFDVMLGDDAKFHYWHEGLGSTIFAIASTAVAGLVWWIMLRRPRTRGLPRYIPSSI
jgi:exosortase